MEVEIRDIIEECYRTDYCNITQINDKQYIIDMVLDYILIDFIFDYNNNISFEDNMHNLGELINNRIIRYYNKGDNTTLL